MKICAMFPNIKKLRGLSSKYKKIFVQETKNLQIFFEFNANIAKIKKLFWSF